MLRCSGRLGCRARAVPSLPKVAHLSNHHQHLHRDGKLPPLQPTPDIQHAPVHLTATEPRKTLTTPPFPSSPRLLRGRYYTAITRSGPPHVGHPPPSCRELRHNARPGYGAALTLRRFEKSLYDLIRGLRNHKGNEKEYIQKSLKECRAEVRGQDMGSSPAIPVSSRVRSYVSRLEGCFSGMEGFDVSLVCTRPLMRYTARSQGDGAAQAHLPRDGRPRHVLGVFPCARGHVVAQVPPEASGISGCSPELSARYRSPDVGYQPAQEGPRMNTQHFQHLSNARVSRTSGRPHRLSSPYLSQPFPTSLRRPWRSRPWQTCCHD